MADSVPIDWCANDSQWEDILKQSEESFFNRGSILAGLMVSVLTLTACRSRSCTYCLGLAPRDAPDDWWGRVINLLSYILVTRWRSPLMNLINLELFRSHPLISACNAWPETDWAYSRWIIFLVAAKMAPILSIPSGSDFAFSDYSDVARGSTKVMCPKMRKIKISELHWAYLGYFYCNHFSTAVISNLMVVTFVSLHYSDVIVV